jgi:CDP-paratose 2-epimerase
MQKHHLPGLVQWFPYGNRDLVESAVKDISELRISKLRTAFSWAEWEMEKGGEWFDYFIGELTKTGVELYPSLFYTPPSRAMPWRGQRKTSHPPEDPEDYVRFLEEMIVRYGRHFEWVQIWNEPNWQVYWEWDIDPNYEIFARMGKKAAEVVHSYGKKAALGGLTPYEPEWIALMDSHGLLRQVDSVSFHQSPGSWPDRRRWFGWDTEIRTARKLLTGLGSKAQVWIAETGYSTIGDDTRRLLAQIGYFETVRRLPVEEVFWYCLYDQDPQTLTDDAINLEVEADQTAYHFGLKYFNNRSKPLFDHWRKEAGHGL